MYRAPKRFLPPAPPSKCKRQCLWGGEGGKNPAPTAPSLEKEIEVVVHAPVQPSIETRSPCRRLYRRVHVCALHIQPCRHVLNTLSRTSARSFQTRHLPSPQLSPPTTPSPPSSTARIHFPLQPLHAAAETLDDVADVPYLVVLGLQLVDGTDYVAHFCYFAVGGCNGGGAAGVGCAD